MKETSLFAFLFLVAYLVGCSGTDSAGSTQTAKLADPSNLVKQMIDDLSRSGELGSGSETLRDELEKMKATDEAKAKLLLSELDRIQKMNDPDQIKAEATKMLEKL